VTENYSAGVIAEEFKKDFLGLLGGIEFYSPENKSSLSRRLRKVKFSLTFN
jgi:hypothetical protein